MVKIWPTILGVLAFQLAFGLVIRAWTGSELWPRIIESALIASGFWTVLPAILLVWHAVTLDRSSPFAATRELIHQFWRKGLQALALLVAFAICFAFINWTKSMIPAFTADPMLADLDRMLFGVDPWRLFDVPMLRPIMAFSYAFWFPVIYFFVIAAWWKGHQRALRSLFVLAGIDTVAQFILPSAGPIFWSRLRFGDRFAALEDGPTTYVMFADLLWAHYESGTLAVGTGISAMPSMHVALSFWLVLAFPKARYFTIPFLAVVFAASVASGWHYVTDGIAGCLIAWGAHVMVAPRGIPQLFRMSLGDRPKV